MTNIVNSTNITANIETAALSRIYYLSHTEPSILSAIANISRSDHVHPSSNTRIVHTGYHLGGFLISDVHSNCQIYRFSAFLQPGEDLLEASNMGVDGHRFSSNVHLLLRKAITLPLFIFILINYCLYICIIVELYSLNLALHYLTCDTWSLNSNACMRFVSVSSFVICFCLTRAVT